MRSSSSSRSSRRHRSRVAAPLPMQELEARQLFAVSVTPFNPANPATNLTTALVAPSTGLNVTGATLSGANGQSGTYTGFNLTSGPNTLVMRDGIVLTSGLATAAQPPVTVGSTRHNRPGDPDLSTLLATTTFDANVLTIQFTVDPSTRSISFDLLFASSEFPQYVASINDGFGAYLDGAQISFDSNGNPINVSNNFFTYDNTNTGALGKTASDFGVGYQGLTTALRTVAPLDANVTTHTLKLVIADAGDDWFDSGVFLANLRGSTRVVSGASTDAGDEQAPGTLAVDHATATVVNTDGSVTVTVNRTGGSDGVVTVDYATADGTAAAGTHYTATTGTLTFADGETTKTITIPVLNNPAAAATTGLTLTLSNATGGAALGGQASQAITIQNNRSEFQFSAGTATATAAGGTVTLTVARAGNTGSASTVQYATADGTAVAGVNYAATGGTLTFAPGETTKTITVAVLANPAAAATATFTLSVSSPAAGGVVGTRGTLAVTITNDKSVVSMPAGGASAQAAGGSVTVTVTRSGNTALAASVGYATVDGTARAGTHYTATSGTLSFAPGETTKTVVVPVLDDVGADASSSFTVAFQAGDGSTVVADGGAAVVTVRNERSAVSFDAAGYAVSEDGGTVTVTVRRRGDLSKAASVDYATADGAAVAGANYVATSGTITFAPGQATASFDVAVVQDGAYRPALDFHVVLTNAGGNAVVVGSAAADVSVANTTVEAIRIIHYDLGSAGGQTGRNAPGAGTPAPAAANRPITHVALTFNQPLTTVPDLTQVTLVATDRERPRGGVRTRRLPVASLSYDPATKSLDVRPAKGLRRNRFHKIEIATIPGVQTGPVAGGLPSASAAAAAAVPTGSASSLWFARGRKLTYVDRDGNRVRLALRGPGAIQLNRSADGQGDVLVVQGATAKSKLRGRVLRTRWHPAPGGQTTLNAVVGLGEAKNLLPSSIAVTGA